MKANRLSKTSDEIMNVLLKVNVNEVSQQQREGKWMPEIEQSRTLRN